jgi:carboxymethylenebutenolidase
MYKHINKFKMKKIALIFALVLFSQISFSQSCCNVNADEMQVFASNKDFQMSHQLPKAYKHVSMVGGEMTSFATAGGQTANGYLIKAKKKSKKYLLVYQEWWGLNDHIKKQAEKFFTDLGSNVNVLAVDMYDGKIATTREDAGKYMGGAKPERLEAIMKGAIAFAGKKAKFASVGWCFGGGLSLKSALLEGKQALGCVMYYGMPVKDVDQLKTLKTDVLGLFAAREQWISPAVVKEFETNMAKAGKKVTIKSFDADHGFSNPSNPIFDKAATEEAYGLAINYLKDRLL